MVGFLKSTLGDIVTGDRHARRRAISAYLGWAAMGAFVAATLAHHFPITDLSEITVSVTGGAIAVTAVFIAKFV